MKAMDGKQAIEKARKARLEHEAEGALSIGVVGAVLGSAAGPGGAIAGAVLGGLAGTVIGAVLDQEGAKREARTRELDAEIGITEGDLGAPNLKHPAAKVGAYSAASVGESGASGDEPAEGPIQTPEG